MKNGINEEYNSLIKQLSAFREIHRVLAETLSLKSDEQKDDMICGHFKIISAAEDTSLFLLNPKSGRFEFRAGAGKKARKYAGSYLQLSEGEIPASGVTSFTAGPSTRIKINARNAVYAFHDKFILIVPVMAFSTVYGILLCEYPNKYAIDEHDRLEIINIFLTHISPVFERSLETRRFEEKARSLELLYEIGTNLSSIRDEDQLLDNILLLIEKYIQVDRCSLMIMDDDRKHLRIRKAFGIHGLDINKIKVPLGVGIAGHVAMSKTPLLIKDIATEKHLISFVQHKENFRTSSLLSVPLVSRGEVIGVINVNNRKDGQPFSEDDMELLNKIGSEIASVLQKSYMALQLKKAKELDRDIKNFMV